MSTLSLSKKRMILRSEGNHVPKELMQFRKERNLWNFPACEDIVRRITNADENVIISEDLSARLFADYDNQQMLERIKSNEDLPGRQDLMSHQRVAVRWLTAIKRGILGDAQGLGKTVMTIVAAKEFGPRRTIVVVPEAKIVDWADHIDRWIDEKAIKLTGSQDDRTLALAQWYSEGGYIVMNFKVMQMHLEDLLKGLGEKDLLIVDEAHKLRNRKTGIHKAAKKISRRTGGVFLLTASPTVNAVEDIWAQLSIIDPDRFGSFWGFVYRFCNVSDDGFGLKINGLKFGEEEALRQMLSPYIIRREDELELAELKYRQVKRQMTGTQARLYKDMAEDNVCSYKRQEITAWDGLAQITRMRQLALSPALIFKDYNGPSKLDSLVAVVNECPGQVVVFANYAKLVNLAVRKLKDSGISAVAISGELASGQREEALNEFKSGEARVIVLTHGTGGEGLDLVEANRAIFLEYAWHPAGNEHAAKRIHRYGQLSDDVEVIFIHTVDSIEDHILGLIQEKKKVTIKELLQRESIRMRAESLQEEDI